jgi:integrase
MARIIAWTDQRPGCARMKKSKPVYSMLVRLLWSCGLRIGEAVALRLGDVDLGQSCLTIREAKNNRTRLVPMSASLARHASRYSQRMGLDWGDPDGFFFPSARGGGYHRVAMSRQMKKIMGEAGVLREDGTPPRVHDVRHSYAVAALAKMERDGTDVYAGLPLLATFMGHSDIKSTEYYLRLTRPEFQTIEQAMAGAYQGLFPKPGQDD